MDLFDFDGGTYEPERDQVRLSGQCLRVWHVIMDGRWHTLADIAEETGDPEASVSARIRDLRKPRNGGHTIERRHTEHGLWEYRLVETAL